MGHLQLVGRLCTSSGPHLWKLGVWTLGTKYSCKYWNHGVGVKFILYNFRRWEQRDHNWELGGVSESSPSDVSSIYIISKTTAAKTENDVQRSKRYLPLDIVDNVCNYISETSYRFVWVLWSYTGTNNLNTSWNWAPIVLSVASPAAWEKVWVASYPL